MTRFEERMNKIFSVLFCTLLFFSWVNSQPAQAKKENNIKFVIDERDSLSFMVHQALLYRNVDIGYDSTIIIQDSESSDIRFYPQLGTGDKNILRIIAGEIHELKPDFYDIFLVIGDSIPDTLIWREEKEKIYIAANGMLTKQTPIAQNITGQIDFTREKKYDFSSARIDLNFRYPFYQLEGDYNGVNLDGFFSLRVGDYRELAMGESDSSLLKKENKRQNLYLAIIFSVFIIAVFGLR